ncbi:hypothetical protein [Polaromonas glacialis]|uniref:hypothetical protein n=1 Tax=Polaromonas glacialis TaxID=866564 RepID=UPI0012EB1EE4|nr:hypothetical protein [Polaromonas glacialis]
MAKKNGVRKRVTPDVEKWAQAALACGVDYRDDDSMAVLIDPAAALLSQPLQARGQTPPKLAFPTSGDFISC